MQAVGPVREVAAAALGATAFAAPAPLAIKLDSSSPSRVTGENALVEVTGAGRDLKLTVNGESVHTVAEETGPVGALDKALRLALEKTYPQLRAMTLRDYKVRILEGNQSASSRTRVLIESGDGQTIWGTVGVSDNIIDASWEALRESVEFKLSLSQS